MSHTYRLQDHFDIDDSMSSTINKMADEKGKTCVSIIIPTHRLGQDRQGDRRSVQEAVATAKQAVSYEHGDYLAAFDFLLEQIDFDRNREGIGIFVSPNIRKLVKFPFPVTKQISVNKSFLFADLLYVENYSTVYYVLHVSKKEIHLFKGIMDHLEEINDQNFPQKISDEYEYNKPSQSSSGAGYAHVKGFEKEKSEVEHLRLKKELGRTLEHLPEYLTKKTPVVLCGPERDASLFKGEARDEVNIIKSINYDYSSNKLHDLEIAAWQQVRSFIDSQKLVVVDEFKEKVGSRLAEYGIRNVRKAAKEGKGFKLLVEKDYTTDAEDRFGKHGDQVNEVITTVLEKKGRVIILEKDVLKDHDRIALINRY